jgi:myo-inositol-1(or 4)-monophosphatase
MSVRLEAEALAALEAVASAEELLVGTSERSVVSTKGSRRDIVTTVDLLLERHITAILARTGLPVVGEEAFAARPELPKGDTPFWLVDPIDGTVNFANGLPYFAISAGLWERGGFRVGAVSLPAFKELFFTHGDESAFLNGRLLEVEPSTIEEALVGASLPGRIEAGSAEQYEIFGRVNEGTRGCLRLGSAAALVCLVACGRLQGAYGFGARLWDVAGAMAIADRAGAEVIFRRYANEPVVDYVVSAPGVGGSLRGLLGKGLSWEEP